MGSWPRRLIAVLLSDRDIRAAIASEGPDALSIEPYDAEMVQPSSIDVRLDNRSPPQLSNCIFGATVKELGAKTIQSSTSCSVDSNK